MRVEFYGLARHRAARPDLLVSAATIGESLASVERVCPNLRILRDGLIASTFLVSLNGERFTTDPGLELADGDQLLILGADAGG